ncbi:metallophosphoesterase family protein [Gorillibacterium sp. sgz5001074]|uniref:metallophosphoesterase family protein n=1 Tax=Gorillibacterium sp. sgz5001074 TaxID=3446695 RepID=UPI003F661786
MKLALIADIHGNYHALQAVLEDIRSRQADRIYVLGDLVFKGPLPERCVRAVRDLNTVVLQGNIDELIGRSFIQPGFAKSPEHEAALRKEMEWTRSRLTEEELAYLAELPFSYDEELAPGLKALFVHANPLNLLDIVLPLAPEEELMGQFGGTDAKLLAYAHIHQPYVRFLNGRAIVNTGSVGLPFDGSPEASYAWIEVEDAAPSDEAVTASAAPRFQISIRRVPYDLEAAVKAFEGSGHPFADSVIRAITTGTRPV